MTLAELGYNKTIEKNWIACGCEGFEVGRVVSEHRERYRVMTAGGEYEAEITGNMRFTAKSREDYPAVGDWAAILPYEHDYAIIQGILPRYSVLRRQAVDQTGEIQVIAANIDYAFLVQAVDGNFNINRLERYLTICHESMVKPIILLSKMDLAEVSRMTEISDSIKSRISNVPVIAFSNETHNGCDAIRNIIKKGKTYCMLGSSGVGKSTLLNNLSGRTVMKTDSLSESTHKGKHITTHRQLVVLNNGGIIIDNPGMREVGIADSTSGLESTFYKIFILSRDCRFKDCTHTVEMGCSVIAGVERGEVSMASYENYLKMERENAHYTSTLAAKRKKEKKFGKLMKNYKKDMGRNNY